MKAKILYCQASFLDYELDPDPNHPGLLSQGERKYCIVWGYLVVSQSCGVTGTDVQNNILS